MFEILSYAGFVAVIGGMVFHKMTSSTSGAEEQKGTSGHPWTFWNADLSTKQRIRKLIVFLMVVGFLFYAGTGVATMFLGGNLLGYDAIAPEPTHHAGQHWGILLVEFGVGMAVASTMMMIFYHFAGREPEMDHEDW